MDSLFLEMKTLWRLHDESILTGDLDGYCLACECYLDSTLAAYKHANLKSHEENLAKLPTVDKYPVEKIFKLKKGYYCSFCNEIIATIAKVNIHITEPKHYNNKGNLQIERSNGMILADQVVISVEAWNSIIDRTCVVCDVEFDNEEEHLKDHNHILNVIQAKCEFGDKMIYRDVDEETFFCLTCGSIYSKLGKSNHHELQNHKSTYIISKDCLTYRNQPQYAEYIENQKSKGLKQNTGIEANPKPMDVDDSRGTETGNENSGQPIAEDNTNNNANANRPVTNDNTNNNANAYHPVTNDNTNNNANNNNNNNKASTNEGPINYSIKKTEVINEPAIDYSFKTRDIDATNNNNLKINANDNDPVRNTIKTSSNNPNIDKTNNNDAVAIKKSKTNENVNSNKINKESGDSNNNKPDGKCDSPKNSTKIQSGTSNARKEPRKKLIAKKKIFENTPIEKPVLIHDPDDLDIKIQNYLRTKFYVVLEDGNAGWCVLCDMSVDNYDTHINKNHHLTCYKKHRERLAKLVANNTEKIVPTPEPNEIQKAIDEARAPKRKKGKKPVDQLLRTAVKSEYLDSELSSDDDENTLKMEENKEYYQENSITIDLNTQKVDCNRCKKIIKFDHVAINAHIKAHNKIGAVNSRGVPSWEKVVVPWYEYPSIKMTVEGANCLICDVTMPTVNTTIKDHLNSRDHRKKCTDGNLKKVASKEFVNTLSRVEHFLCNDVVINNQYVISFSSFLFNIHRESGLRCGACDVDLCASNLHTHNASIKHVNYVSESVVITALANEFIREIKPRKYHCGYCNVVTKSWANLESHLDSPEHDEARTSAAWSYERYKAYLKTIKQKEVHSIINSFILENVCF